MAGAETAISGERVRELIQGCFHDLRDEIGAGYLPTSEEPYLLGLSSFEAAKLEEFYASHPSDVIKVKTAWKMWNVGVQETGLIYLIEAAEQKSAAVPLPTEWLRRAISDLTLDKLILQEAARGNF